MEKQAGGNQNLPLGVLKADCEMKLERIPKTKCTEENSKKINNEANTIDIRDDQHQTKQHESIGEHVSNEKNNQHEKQAKTSGNSNQQIYCDHWRFHPEWS